MHRIVASILLATACAAPSSAALPVPDAGSTTTPACDEWLPPVKVADVAVDGLEEASGLAASRALPGVFFTIQDSGHDPEIVAFDTDG